MSNNKLTDEELDQIRQRCDKASRGPWKSYIEGRDHLSGDSVIITGVKGEIGEDIYLTGATDDDQDFIAHARQDIPRLLDEVERLKRVIKEQ